MEPGPTDPTQHTPPPPPPGYAPPGMWVPGARMPIPGNAELAIYILALFLAMLVCWIADSLGSADWFVFFRWITVAYILSRGIAKASRVLEQ